MWATRCSIRASASREEDSVTDIAISATPKRPNLVKRLSRSIALLRESRVGMLGAFLVAFWILMALIADILPLRDPLAQSAPDLLKPMFTLAPDGGYFWLGTD